MPRMATEPLTKVTLNLFEADVRWFQQRYGQGYSTTLRDIVRQRRLDLLKMEQVLNPLRFGTGEYDE